MSYITQNKAAPL